MKTPTAEFTIKYYDLNNKIAISANINATDLEIVTMFSSIIERHPELYAAFKEAVKIAKKTIREKTVNVPE